MSILFNVFPGKPLLSSIQTCRIVNQRLLKLYSFNSSNNKKLNKKSNKLKTSSEIQCLEIVKKFDYENFLSSLFIRNYELRRTAFALKAFNVELSQIRDLTKSDSMAKIRFQFWLDIIDDIYKNKSKSIDSSMYTNSSYHNFPVAFELEKILLNSDLSKHWLRKLVVIRSESIYLSSFPFQTMEQVEKYCEASLASLYYLLNEKIIEISQNKNAGHRIALDHIANHLAKAQGFTNILRGIKHNAINRRCYVPNDVLVKSKCSHEDLIRYTVSENVCNAVFEIASHANSHLEHAIELITELKGNENKETRLMFIQYVAVKSYLELLQQCDFNIFHEKLYRKNGMLPWKLWWKAKFI